jgi:hypothetical protein
MSTRKMTEEPAGSLVARITEELASCRQRGIERLNLSSHNQAPVQTPVLEGLASEYIAARQLRVYGRIPQLKCLFRDAIKDFAAENEADAQLVGDLFFGDSENRVAKSAGELLDAARKKFGYRTDKQFRDVRRDAFAEFARFLPDFVRNARRGNPENAEPGAEPSGSVSVLPRPGVTPPDSAPDLEVQHQDATTGYVANGEYFIRLLAEASNVTIVGFTNEQLAPMLKAALERKRAALSRADACWNSLRVVFLSDKLLDLVNDDRREYSDRVEVLKQRRRAAMHGRRAINDVLRSLPPARWTTYASPCFPPLIGTLFEMPNGQRIVQLLFRRPQRSAEDHLYLQLEDTQENYFSAAFEEIVHSSVDDTKVVPVGFPAIERFRVTGTRCRQNVLRDGPRANGWLPLVLVITWRTHNGRPVPLLQLRTHLNAGRQFDRLSHLSAYVLDEDRRQMPEFGLGDEVPLRAARRRVQMETSEEDSGTLRPLGTSRYLHCGKEHLFFFLYACEFPEDFQLCWQAEMYPLSVAKHLAIRENQALRLARSLCESPPMRGRARDDTFEIAALNLTLHGYPEVAWKLTNAATQGATHIAQVAPEIRNLEEQTRQTWPGSEKKVVLKGLSGLQYREFFSLLLPYYASFGVLGAADHLRRINEDETARAAVARLAELYHDEGVMESIPIEL